MHWKRPNTSVKPPITSVVLTLRGPKHHEPARPPCPQSSGTCRQGLAGRRGPRARREQPVVSLARSGAAAQTGHRDMDPARDWMGPPTLRYQGNVDGPSQGESASALPQVLRAPELRLDPQRF